MGAVMAMPSSTSRETAEKLLSLVGVGAAAPDAKEGPRARARAAASSTEEEEARIRALRAAAAEERRRMQMLLPRPRRPPAAAGPFRRLARLWRRLFVRFDPDSIPVCQPLDDEQIEMLERVGRPGYFEQLAWERQLATECLQHYNSMHPGNEYEPAPGKVSHHPHFHNGICWAHGNFVARKKRSGCFSFVPAPRTLFFFELAYINGCNRVVTCTALDEPVTEAYSVLGFPLWWSARRRTGIFDSICKTCHCRFEVPRPAMRKTYACGHNNVHKICEMCYRRSHVLHPDPGEFAFGYHHPYHPYPTSTDDITDQKLVS